MNFPVIKKSYSPQSLEIDKYEVLRFLGYKRSAVTEDDLKIVDSYIPEVISVCKPAACYCRFVIELQENNKIIFPYGTVESKDLTRNLSGCKEIWMFCTTIGLDFDRLLQRTRISSMAKASFFQSIGAVAVENVCDKLNEELKNAAENEGFHTKPRYSAGYGDWGLENQKGIFELLNPAVQIGVSLKENLIMVPEKSVTAIIGIY